MARVIQAVLMGSLAHITVGVPLFASNHSVANRIRLNRSGSLVGIRHVEVH